MLHITILLFWYLMLLLVGYPLLVQPEYNYTQMSVRFQQIHLLDYYLCLYSQRVTCCSFTPYWVAIHINLCNMIWKSNQWCCYLCFFMNQNSWTHSKELFFLSILKSSLFCFFRYFRSFYSFLLDLLKCLTSESWLTSPPPRHFLVLEDFPFSTKKYC